MDVFITSVYNKSLPPESGNGDLGVSSCVREKPFIPQPRTRQPGIENSALTLPPPQVVPLEKSLKYSLWSASHTSFLTSLSLPLSFHTATQLVRAKNCLGQKLTKAVISYYSNFLCCKHMEGEVLVSKGAILHFQGTQPQCGIVSDFASFSPRRALLVTTPGGSTCSKVSRISPHPCDNHTRAGMHPQMEGKEGV